jgi:hypothetical protein
MGDTWTPGTHVKTTLAQVHVLGTVTGDGPTGTVMVELVGGHRIAKQPSELHSVDDATWAELVGEPQAPRAGTESSDDLGSWLVDHSDHGYAVNATVSDDRWVTAINCDCGSALTLKNESGIRIYP